MKITFSIIIPVYNVAGYIEKTLASIKEQTYQDYEVILVDDGSTDATPLICDEFEKNNSRVTVIHKKNEGVSVARNVGIDKAKGSYFLFFDGDDFIEPDCLADLANITQEKQIDTIIYGYYRYENDSIKETNLPSFEKELYLGKYIMNYIFPRFVGLSYSNIREWLNKKKDALIVENPALWRSMVSACIIKENGLYFNKNLKVGEDTLFISEYLSYAKACYIQRKCYYYLVTRETSTIYQYEKKPLAKLEGKINQLKAREELTQRLIERLGVDITEQWAGTVLMSCMELAFLLTKIKKLSFFKKYSMFLSYVNQKEVKKMVTAFKIGNQGGIKKLPFFLLKHRCSFLLFICAQVLQLLHYEFSRN